MAWDSRYLELVPPEHVGLLTELGDEAAGPTALSPVGITSPFRLLGDEGVAILQAICTELEGAAGSDERIAKRSRGGVYRSEFLRGLYGDPSVLGRAGNDSLTPWTAALRARGIGRIDGRLIADDNAVEEPRPGFAWSWEDLAYAYGAVAGALNLGENALALVVWAGTAENAAATIESPSEAGDLSIVNHATTGPAGSTALLWPEWLPGDTRLTIEGSIPLGSPPVRLGVASGNPTRSVVADLPLPWQTYT